MWLQSFFCFLLYYQRKMLRPVCNLHLTETKFFWKGDSALREKASKDPRFAKYLSRVSLHPLDYVTIVHDACYTKTVLASSIKARRPCHSRDNDRWCMLRIGFCDDNDQDLFFEMKRKQNTRNDKTQNIAYDVWFHFKLRCRWETAKWPFKVFTSNIATWSESIRSWGIISLRFD